MTRLLKWMALLLLAAAAAVAVAGWQAEQALQTPLDLPEGGASYRIEPGTPFARVSRDLAERGWLADTFWLDVYARISGKAADIQAGEYWLEAGASPLEVLAKFVDGDVRLHAFTIVEGWNFRELLAALAADPNIVATLTYDDWPELLESLGSDYEHPEGLFLPETYHFPAGTTDREVLRRAHAYLQEALREEWAARATGLPLETPYEALTLASIIEKETARADERARIAGVFVRRLQKGMRLQTDPTVIYGVGEAFDGDLTRRHLRTDTPYNTYTRGGLPPTPIAMPGRAAINAALHPADGNELYFVATGLGDGSHKFSATKAEHDAAVAEYLARLRSTRGRQ